MCIIDSNRAEHLAEEAPAGSACPVPGLTGVVSEEWSRTVSAGNWSDLSPAVAGTLQKALREAVWICQAPGGACETSGPQSTNSCDHFSYFKPLGSESPYPVKPGTGPDGVNQVRGPSVGAKRVGGASYPESRSRLRQHFLSIVSLNICSYLPLC